MTFIWGFIAGVDLTLLASLTHPPNPQPTNGDHPMTERSPADLHHEIRPNSGESMKDKPRDLVVRGHERASTCGGSCITGDDRLLLLVRDQLQLTQSASLSGVLSATGRFRATGVPFDALGGAL
jgi:hypothetical protein